MRKKLKQYMNERGTFEGMFVRRGTKNTRHGKNTKTTVLIKCIKNEDGEVVANHLWFDFNKDFYKANLKKGDIVSFDATVVPYLKGTWSTEKKIDFKLDILKNIRVVQRRNEKSKRKIQPEFAKI
jgi:hypothetical protein